MDLSRCRICLYKVEAENSKSVFAAAKDGQLISEILSRFASVQINTSDGLPSAICNNCEEKLNMLIDFREEIRRSDSTLRSSCNTDDTIICSSIGLKDEWNYADDATTSINDEDEDQNDISVAESYNFVDNNDPLAFTYFCEVCNKKFSDLKVLMKHEEFHDEAMPFKCYECEKGFSQQDTLFNHNKIYHSEYELVAVPTMSDTESTLPDLGETADERVKNLLPDKSKSIYYRTYNTYMAWCSGKGASNFGSEGVLLTYFAEEATKKKASTLWAVYSMLKATLNINHKIDISKHSKLLAYLKKQNVGYKPRKSRVFSRKEIDKFINEAPKEFLPQKVALIIGVSGACRSDELFRMKLSDVEFSENRISIVIPHSQSHKNRSFIINNHKWISIVQEYVQLHKRVENDRFFFQVRFGKMTKQPFGHNAFSLFPKKIATYLKLSNAHEYTGHCFRRTGATLLFNNEADIRQLKRMGVSRSNTIPDSSLADQQKIAEVSTNNHLPSTSKS